MLVSIVVGAFIGKLLMKRVGRRMVVGGCVIAVVPSVLL
jgi:hypothetical protein